MNTDLNNVSVALRAIARASPKQKLEANRWSFVVRPNGNVELWIETDDAYDDLLVTAYKDGKVKKQKVLRIIPPSSYYYWR